MQTHTQNAGLISLALVLVAVSVAAAPVLVGSNLDIPNSPDTMPVFSNSTIEITTLCDMTDWRTYRNQEYGFTLHLPATFVMHSGFPGYLNFIPAEPTPQEDEPADCATHDVWMDATPRNEGYWRHLSTRKITELSDDQVISPSTRSMVQDGSATASVRRENINGIDMAVVSSILGKPTTGYNDGGWIEGAWESEALFACHGGKDFCSIKAHSHTSSMEKKRLFRAILSTVQTTE